ncbi:MAG: NADH oxidase [Candidatus Magnetoglobus multicellularis str. Araruama]|uniref:NADH oxidase n=1 Tax=Candidatus Magnetoglobus multicellularis str. Araruama TaxID=890399 RepID=A0A1V1P905_9BACT|nr:MAG: NADH oxidase [Candidatus Magnetoglobus multicellularis str. Araruama]
MESLRVVIIGGVACGPKTAARLRRLHPNADITLVEKDSIVSYGACGLPYYVEGLFSSINTLIETPVGVARTPAFFDKAKGFKVFTRTEAVKVDRDKKQVEIKNCDTDERSALPYDKLVLATGGLAFHPPIPGIDLKNVWFMTHPNHAESLVKEIQSQGLKKAAMVGAGFIGIEMAEALIHRGLSVHLIEMADQIMPGVLDHDIATYASKHLKQKGVQLVLGDRVTGVTGDTKATGVTTESQKIDADAVIIAVGTRPNDTLARDAGLECMARGGIVINSYCQTSDPDIYAGGDCAVNTYIDRMIGTPMYVPLGSTANKHGRVIANHIAGNVVPFGGISGTGIVKAFDFNISRTGVSEKQAKDLNMAIETTYWAGPDRPHYMPDSKPLLIKMIACKKTRKLLGVQAAGMGDVARRIDTAAAVIRFGGTLDELSDIDFAYAPPFSPPIDPLATCAHILLNKLDGIANGISAYVAKQRIENDDVLLLDVRTPGEVETMQLPYPFMNIPLGALREKADNLPKDKDIIAFCKVSMRGYEAQRILNAKGFDRVWFIEGGVIGWPFEIKML